VSTNIHDEVTARIVAELEQGSVPWVKPWKSGLASAGAGCLPENAATGRAYAGVNILTLWAAAATKGYPLPRWLTFRQARGLGGHVRKGERGTAIVLLKRVTVPDAKAGADKEDGTREVAFLRAFTVFNVAQVDDLPERVYAEPQPLPEGERHGRAEAFLAATGADVRHGGDRACYIPSLDRIQLPPFAAFEEPGHYYATSLHEHAHWTAHADRLDRDLSGRFGDAAYGVEELIAELTAAFLCAELGIEGRLRHAEYIGGWLELLKADNRAVFAAASQASRAAEYLRAFSAAEMDPDRRIT
jgi:antirestriction protein ArdC